MAQPPQSRPEQEGTRHLHPRRVLLLERRKERIVFGPGERHRRLTGHARECYLYPAGNVIGFGYGVEGYLEVTLWNGPPRPKTTYSVETLHAMIDEQARAVGYEDVPVRFTVRTSPPILNLGPQYG